VESELAERLDDLREHYDALAAADDQASVPTSGLGLAVHGPVVEGVDALFG
jgi:hypothetical protein